MHGVWVDAFGEGIRSRTEIDRLVAFAQACGLDTLVVQVSRRGEMLANDLPLPRATSGVADPPFDPLAAVCDAAHAGGLTVHAWLGVTPIAPAGAPADGYEPWLSRCDHGTARDRHGVAHLDPGHPEVRAFVAELAATVAERYPVDGVNLDRVRYPESPGGARWGHNPVALKAYAADTGRDAPPEPDDEDWQAWRRAQVTALVEETAAAVRAARSGVLVSTTACCFGGLDGGWEASRAFTELGQDWVGWLRDARVDHVLAMNYRGDTDDRDLVPDAHDDVDLDVEGAVAEVAEPRVLRARFDDWAKVAIEAGRTRAVLGTGLYLHDVATNADDARHALALTADGQGAGGWCGFSYRNPSRAVLRGVAAADAERSALADALRPVLAP